MQRHGPARALVVQRARFSSPDIHSAARNDRLVHPRHFHAYLGILGEPAPYDTALGPKPRVGERASTYQGRKIRENHAVSPNPVCLAPSWFIDASQIGQCMS